MVDTVFLSILDMTKVGSLVILAVLLVRLLLRRAPRVISYALWLVVLFRLLCPVGLQAPISLVPEITPTAQTYQLEDQPISFGGAGMAAYHAVGDVLNGGIDSQRVATDLTDSAGNVIYVSAPIEDVWILFGSYVWAAGLAVMGLYSAFTFLSLKRRLREAIPLEPGVFLADGISSPFVMGRRIYLPQGLEDRERTYILAHERHHLRRQDPLWKALGFLALCIHWFNPLVWIAFVLSCRDMEMSCDEAVVKTFGPEIRGDYAASLLKIATGKRFITGVPLAFGEGDPKSRIKNLAKWKKPILWISIGAVVLCGVLAVCLLTDPIKETREGTSLFFGTLRYVEGEDMLLDCEDGRAIRFRLSEGYQLPEGIEAGDPVMVRAVWRESAGAYITARVSVTESAEKDSLDAAIEAAVLQAEGRGIKDGHFAAVSFVTLSKSSQGIASSVSGEQTVDTVTVYGLALYQAYSCENGSLQEHSGSHIPVALTFRVSDAGQYCLTEYWMPRDGSYYVKDLKAKFPLGQVPDTQKYINAQKAECLAKAREHFDLDGSIPSTEEPTVPPTTEAVPAFDMQLVPKLGPKGPIVPLEKLPDHYRPEQAILDDVVVIEYGNVYANAYLWERFVQSVEHSNPARVRVMVSNMAQVGHIRDILFDGTRFRTRTTVHSNTGEIIEVHEHDFAHLQVFRGENRMPDGTVYESYTTCFLTPEWIKSIPEWAPISFPTEDGVQLVYQAVVSTMQHPALPDNVTSAKIMLEDQVLAQIGSGWQLNSLMELLSAAEYMPDVNSYAVFEPLALVLESANGTQTRCVISTQSDSIRINGSIYDYGPGRVMRNGEAHFRNAILEMVRHFGLEDWPSALREYCMANGIEPPGHSLKVIVGEEPHS